MTDFKNKLTVESNRRQAKRLNLRTINIALFVVIITLGLAYVICVNDLTVKGFALKEMKSQADYLASENQEIEAKVMAMQSYNSLISKVKDLNMVAVDEVDYLTVSNTIVAKK